MRFHFVLLLLMQLVLVNQVDQQMPLLFKINQVYHFNIQSFLLLFFLSIEKPSFLDLHGIKDITVKAGQDFEVHIPYKATPKAQAQWLIDDKDLINDDHINVKVKYKLISIRLNLLFYLFIYFL